MREHFVGEERKDDKGKPYWIARRVELNDLSSPQLVAYVERKLEESGALGKVIPQDAALVQRRERIYRAESDAWVDAIIEEMLGIPALKKKMAEDFQEHFKLQGAEAWIKTTFKRDDTSSWRDGVKATLRAAYDAKHKPDLEAAVRKAILAVLSASR